MADQERRRNGVRPRTLRRERQRTARATGADGRQAAPSFFSSPAFVVAALLLVTLLAYQPIWHAQFIWDDDFYVINNTTLRDLGGLRRIWFEIGAVPQYYPLVHTVFWIEYHLWGLNPLGFHLVNVLLHVAAAVLLWRTLLFWQIPAATLTAFVFALHPLQVESVAWVTELKNILSAVFYFAAALAYGGFVTRREAGERQRGAWYAGALFLFVAALLSKTTACSLPAALLLVIWWRRGRLTTVDTAPLLPFFALGAALGLQTAAIERRVVGAEGAEFAFSLLERVLIAGRALWFYAAKLLLPIELSFIYPRWHIDVSSWWQWLFPAGAAAVVVSLWSAHQRLGRGPLAATLFFAGTLFPALGFIDVYPMRYSFVADHFQYVACIGLIVLGSGALGAQLAAYHRRSPSLGPLLGGVLVAVLAVATWQRVWAYADLETLWRATLRTNPDSSMVHNNLANLLLSSGRQDEALTHLRTAVELEPDNIEARNSLGFVLMRRGRLDEALGQYRAALATRSGVALTHYNLGAALVAKQEFEPAIAEFETAIELAPTYADARHDLGNLLANRQRIDAALGHLQAAVALQPANPNFHNSLGVAFVRADRVDEAIAQFQQAVKLRPDFVEAHNNLRYVAWLLATAPEPQRRDGAQSLAIAVRLDELTGHSNPLVAETLAAAYAESGRFEEAMTVAQRAVDLAKAQDLPEIARKATAELEEYRGHQAHREAPSER